MGPAHPSGPLLTTPPEACLFRGWRTKDGDCPASTVSPCSAARQMAAAARAGVADLSLPRRSCGVTAPSAGRSMTPGGRPRLARCGACGGGDVGEAAEEGVQGGPAVVDCGAFLVGERDGGEHALQLREARFLRDGHVSVQRAVIQLVGLCEPPGQIDVESRFGYLIRWWQAGSTPAGRWQLR